jgi:hypothetical protein
MNASLTAESRLGQRSTSSFPRRYWIASTVLLPSPDRVRRSLSPTTLIGAARDDCCRVVAALVHEDDAVLGQTADGRD